MGYRGRNRSLGHSVPPENEVGTETDSFRIPPGYDTSGLHMRTLDRLGRWKDSGAITKLQHDAIAGIVRKDRFSVYLELNILLYLGALSIAGGVGWTVREHFSDLGDFAILSSLFLVLAVSFYYCFSRALPFSLGEVESPNPVVDYVLYLACALFSITLGYIEFRFQMLRDAWDYYLLVSAIVFFVLSYRFDNRFVLSLGLSTLAGWFGLRFWRFGFISPGSLRGAAMAYGAIVAAMGAYLQSREIKKHFFETYLHVAANVVFMATLSGVDRNAGGLIWVAGLVVLGVFAVTMGIRNRKFPFVAYGTIYPYLGISFELLRDIHDNITVLSYVVVSGTAVVIWLVYVARRFGRES